MTNKQRQVRLNEIKWNESLQEHMDKSGKMPWCEHCTKKGQDGYCSITHDERDRDSVCATAYNRMMRKKG